MFFSLNSSIGEFINSSASVPELLLPLQSSSSQSIDKDLPRKSDEDDIISITLSSQVKLILVPGAFLSYQKQVLSWWMWLAQTGLTYISGLSQRFKPMLSNISCLSNTVLSNKQTHLTKFSLAASFQKSNHLFVIHSPCISACPPTSHVWRRNSSVVHRGACPGRYQKKERIIGNLPCMDIERDRAYSLTSYFQDEFQKLIQSMILYSKDSLEKVVLMTKVLNLEKVYNTNLT